MGSITGLTAARMLAIEASSVVGGTVNGAGHLILTKHDASTIDAGSVIGPMGPTGPAGSAGSASRVDIQMAASGIGVHLGMVTAGQNDALNITPYGAAAVVIASGSDYVGGVSTARAGSATQIEMLNSGINLFADSGTTVGASYSRTRRMAVDTNGALFTGYNPGTTHESLRVSGSTQVSPRGVAINTDSQTFSGGITVGLSIAINRSDPAIAVKNGAGDMIQGYNPTTGKRFTVDLNGSVFSAATASYFGGGALGADMSAVAVGQYDPDYASISAYQTVRANCHLLIASKGTGSVIIRNGGDTSKSFAIGADGKIATSQAAANLVTTVGAAGGAAALPATPLGYMIVTINGTDRKIPYYNV